MQYISMPMYAIHVYANVCDTSVCLSIPIGMPIDSELHG